MTTPSLTLEELTRPRAADYAEWAKLDRMLDGARYRRKHLDYPLCVRVQEEPRKERAATDEEVARWKADADAEIAQLEAQQTAIEAAHVEASASAELRGRAAAFREAASYARTTEQHWGGLVSWMEEKGAEAEEGSRGK